MTCLEPDMERYEHRTVGLPIIDSYPPLAGWQLHSLAHQVNFTCAMCNTRRESVMLAIDDGQRPACPACYARQLGDRFPA